MISASRGGPMAERPKRSAVLCAAMSWRRLQTLARDLTPTLCVVVAVVALLVLLRSLQTFALEEPMPALQQMAELAWGDFWVHLTTVLLMLALIEPARRLGPEAGLRRAAVLVPVVALAAAAAAAFFPAEVTGPSLGAPSGRMTSTS